MKIQKTVMPIHFEDRSGTEFERLVFAFIYQLRIWNKIDWLGQTGKDGGRDIWGVFENETYCYQCANYRQLNFKKAKEDIDKLIKGDTIPNFLIIVCGGSVSAKLRSDISKYAGQKGIPQTEIWSGREFEEKLRSNAPLIIKRFVDGEIFPESQGYLFSTVDMDDPWMFLYNSNQRIDIEFIGRSLEIERLNLFAECNEIFLWEVLHGDNAVGKTKLAKEWLNFLRLKSESWTTIFLDNYNEQTLLHLLKLVPSGPTVFILDDVYVANAYIWDFIIRANENWYIFNLPIRVILISHINLEPISVHFSLTQRLNKLRYSEQIKKKEKLIVESRIISNDYPGINIGPLVKEDDIKKILFNASAYTSRELPEWEVSYLIHATAGRPAFLILAGLYPEDWHRKLNIYARQLIERAIYLFGRESDILRLLVLSCFLGPIDDFVRLSIAPNIHDLIKLGELFSKPPTALQEKIPMIEPDLFANEILFTIMGDYLSKSQQIDLINKIFDLLPEIFLERTADLWNIYMRYMDSRHALGILSILKNEYNKENSSYRTLELFFQTIASKNTFASRNSPFVKVAETRSRILAYTLEILISISDELCKRLVEFALTNLPCCLSADYFLEIHKDASCTQENRFLWADLIYKHMGDIYAPNKFRLYTEDFKNHQIVDEVLNKFNSQNIILRVYAAFQISTWASFSLEKDLDEIGTVYFTILTKLIHMSRSEINADRIAANITLKWIVCRDGMTANGNILDRKARLNVEKELFNRTNNPVLLISLVKLIQRIFQSHYYLRESLNWLPDNLTRNYSPIYKYEQIKPSNKLVNELKHIYITSNLNTVYQQDFTISLIFLDIWIPEMQTILINILFNSNYFNHNIKSNIIVRLVKIGSEETTTLLKKILVFDSIKFPIEFRYLALSGMLQNSFHYKLNENEILKICREINISPKSLLNEAKTANYTKLWKGKEALKLKKKLRKFYISVRGHIIHKIKAKNSSGKWVYYFVLVESEQEKSFMEAIGGKGTINLDDYGIVVASCYGEVPSNKIKKYLENTYGFDHI